ncbi:MAG: hypothetical protein ACK5ML_04400 [Lachnospiraceae bacterium]
MKIQEFIRTYKPKFQEYCPAVIDSEGNVYECSVSHLKTLEEIAKSQEKEIVIPGNVSPLLFLTAKLSCVLVDYENQIYSISLTNEQQEALLLLYQAKLINYMPKNIQEEYYL